MFWVVGTPQTHSPRFSAMFLPLIAVAGSNDDLALRKEFYSRRRSILQNDSGGSKKAKLTAMEVLVLCWERGLLRSQHWPEAQLRRKALGDRAGSAPTAVDESIPDAVAKTMLHR